MFVLIIRLISSVLSLSEKKKKIWVQRKIDFFPLRQRFAASLGKINMAKAEAADTVTTSSFCVSVRCISS